MNKPAIIATAVRALLTTSALAQAPTYRFTEIGHHTASNGQPVTEFEVRSQGKAWHTCETPEGFEVDCQTGKEP